VARRLLEEHARSLTRAESGISRLSWSPHTLRRVRPPSPGSLRSTHTGLAIISCLRHQLLAIHPF
jgi:hypothetical protein